MKLPDRLSSLALPKPIRRESFCDSPHPGSIPTRTCVSANRASSLAYKKSQPRASSKPPVTAAPLTAPIMGFLQVRIATESGDSVPNPSSVKTLLSLLSSDRSTPAQNAFPAPVITITAVSSDASAAFIASISSRVSARFNALFALGLLRVRTLMRFDVSRVMNW